MEFRLETGSELNAFLPVNGIVPAKLWVDSFVPTSTMGTLRS